MKATVKHINSGVPKDEYKLYDDFMKFLQKEFPLKGNMTVLFLGERKGDMTTGSRTSDNELKILSKGRMNRDILRTLAHEWIHEYQRTILKRSQGANIGGRNENEANSGAGILMKKFEKSFPEIEDQMYQ
jgi:hypothetical protein